jgi:methane/ammonia monooxygenase subunit B
MMNVEGGGPVIGPGKWVTIEGTLSQFRNEVTTLTGKVVDVERFGATTAYFWHGLQYLIGMGWMWWWCRRPTFVPRFLKVASGNEAGLVTEEDRKVTIIFMVGTVVFVTFGYFKGSSDFPVTMPLQAGVIGVMTPAEVAGGVNVHLIRASYRVPGREVVLSFHVTNNTESPIQVAELETGGVRFLNADVKQDDTGYPQNLLAESGLTVDDNAGVAPGETKQIEVRAQDAAWETERLSDLIYDPDSRFGALLFFKNAQGEVVVPVGGPMIPGFT